MKKLIWSVILILLSYNSPKLVMAQADQIKTGFSISPPLVDIVINEADKQKSYILNISNNSQKSEVFNLSVVDFGSLEKSAGVAFFGFEKSELENKYALASWLQLEKDAFVVDPGQNMPIKITIINRQSLSPGGHYGAVVVKLVNQAIDGKELVGINQNYASLIFVRKTGGQVYRLKLIETTYAPNPILIPDTINLTFQNVGNVHLVPRGKIEIRDPKNRLVSKGIINTDSSIIMPESFRNYVTKLNKVNQLFWPGVYKISVSFRHQGMEEFEDYKTNYNYLGGPLFWGPIVGLPVLITAFLIKTNIGRNKKKITDIFSN